jgi:hypothetical protein
MVGTEARMPGKMREGEGGRGRERERERERERGREGERERGSHVSLRYELWLVLNRNALVADTYGCRR